MANAPPTTSSATSFRLETREGGAAILTFDMPNSRANTLGQPVIAELESVLAQLQSRTDVKGLIFRSGKPGMFIAGADLRELGGAKPDPEQSRRLVKRGLAVIATIESLPYPTVAAIDGAC